MTNTLGLDDDLDGVDMVECIEHGFGVTISDETAATLLTVGDIYDTLMRQLGPLGDTAGRCATAMAFYRIRRALRQEGATRAAWIETDLDAGGWPSVRRLSKRLKSEFGLQLPAPTTRWPGAIGVIMVIGGLWGVFGILPISEAHWWVPLVIAGIGAGMVGLDPWRLPADCRTVGQLSAKVARLNRGPLRRQGGTFRLADVWDDLVELLSEHTDLPKSQIRADTWLLQSVADRNRAT